MVSYIRSNVDTITLSSAKPKISKSFLEYTDTADNTDNTDTQEQRK